MEFFSLIVLVLVMIYLSNRNRDKITQLGKKIDAVQRKSGVSDQQDADYPPLTQEKSWNEKGPAITFHDENAENAEPQGIRLSAQKEPEIVMASEKSVSVRRSDVETDSHDRADDVKISYDTDEPSVGVTQQNHSTYEQTIVDRFIVWLKEDWPLKIGGFLIILAIGWFVSFAVDNNWLTEGMRVMLGYLAGVGALVYGTFRANTVRVQGNTFLIMGVAAILASTLGAVHFAILSPLTALIVMFVAVAFVSLVSLKQESLTLTASMIAFGASVPLFFISGLVENPDFIFLYLFVLTIGTLWIVSRTGWNELTTLMLMVVAAYSVVFGVFDDVGPSWKNMILALVFTGIFYTANVASILRAKKESLTDYFTAIGVSVMYMIWVYLFGIDEFIVMLLLLGALLFVVASYLIYMTTKVTKPTMIYGGAAAILIAVATAEVADGAVLTIAYLVEATVAIAASIYVLGDRMTQGRQILSIILFGGPSLLLLGSIDRLFGFIHPSRGGQIGDMLPHLLAIFVAIICVFAIALTIRTFMSQKNTDNVTYMKVFAYFGFVLSLGFVWLFTHTFADRFDQDAFDRATFVSLFVYMVTGMVFYIRGIKQQKRLYQVVAGILFAIVLARIFFVEIQNMDESIKIATFFVIGALFIAAAYMARKYKK